MRRTIWVYLAVTQGEAKGRDIIHNLRPQGHIFARNIDNHPVYVLLWQHPLYSIVHYHHGVEARGVTRPV